MRFCPLALFFAAMLPVSALAERYGSETPVTIQGTYYLEGTATTQTLANGNILDTVTHLVVPINNATILQAMKSRSLIPSTSGYQLVMVGHAHMADGAAWFATPRTGAPVPVPTDLLLLQVSDGPINGKLIVDSDDVLKTMSRQSHNEATLTLDGFSGYGMLTQTWTSRVVKNGTANEGVELVTTTGNLVGKVSTTGVGSVNFSLTGAKVVDLTRYGMATTTTSEPTFGGTLGATVTYTSTTTLSVGSFTPLVDYYTTNGSLTKTGTGTLSLSGTITYTGGITITNGTLNVSSANLASTGTVTINTTTGGSVTGLVIDADGNVTQFPAFGTPPATLVIITSSGTHTYTHDANGVWTLVTQ